MPDITVSSDVDSMLRAASNAAIRTTIGLGDAVISTPSGTTGLALFTTGVSGVTTYRAITGPDIASGDIAVARIATALTAPGSIGSLTPGGATFSTLGVAAASSPTLFLTGTIANAVGSLSMSTDALQPGHDLAVVGLNMKMGTGGLEPIEPTEGAWGMIIERDYVSTTGSVQNEAYYSTAASERPFSCGFAESVTATITNITNGLVTISTAGNDFLPEDLVGASGLKIKFTALSGISGVNASGITTGVYYYVKTRPTPTTFTLSTTLNGLAVTDFSATSGTVKRGGYGLYSITVPSSIDVGGGGGINGDYGSPDIIAETAFAIINSVAGKSTNVRFNNNATGRNDIRLFFNDAEWVIGHDIASNTSDNLFAMKLNGSLVGWQIDSGGRLLVGYTGYTDRTGAAPLDVNGAAKIGTTLGVGATPTYGTLQVGSVVNAPGTSSTLYLGGGSGSEVTRIRTGSYDNNAQYGFFLKTNYTSDTLATLGVTSNSTDYVGLSIFKSATGAAIGIGQSTAVTPVASALLEMSSTTKGLLPPRMTTTQRTSISSPAEGLQVYDLTLHKTYTYDGTSWVAHW